MLAMKAGVTPGWRENFLHHVLPSGHRHRNSISCSPARLPGSAERGQNYLFSSCAELVQRKTWAADISV